MINKIISRLNQKLELSDVTKIIIGFGLLLIAYEFFYLDIDNAWWFSLIIFPPLFAITFVALSVYSLIFMFLYFSSISSRAFIPIALNGLVLFASMYFFYPIRHLRIETEFILKRRGFEQVIQMIEAGTLQSDKYGQANLPKEYEYLSSNNKISAYEENDVLYVSFDTNAAIVFPKAHFMYTSSQTPPDVDIRLNVYQINPHWYLVSYL